MTIISDTPVSNTQISFIKEVCRQENIAVQSLSKDYIIRLTKGNQTRNIAGPYWDINSAASDRIACDKFGCYTVLNGAEIPAIPHQLFFNPTRRGEWIGENGSWTRILEYFRTHGEVVAKNNEGWGGLDVYHCTTALELEKAVSKIFQHQPNVTLSPFKDIKTEYRIFYLNGKTPFAYGKAKGEDWKFNLAQGATAFLIKNYSLKKSLEELAKKAAHTIGITFATVDIAQMKSGKLAVMEINAGVQARFLVDQMPELRKKIKSIYTEAILHMFEGEKP